ncbi:MAG TPA: T9SS type A sorting domain-containing protein [Bacteroidota bacterium]|nr:T9SS type A sorting domain-containing protein [Bacteroidota bacterium]
MKNYKILIFILAIGSLALPLRSPARQSDFVVPLVIADPLGQSDTIWFGRDHSATNCIDDYLGEIDMQGDTLNGRFHFRFMNPGFVDSACGWGATRRDIRPHPSSDGGNEWKISFAVDSSLFPSTLSWPDLGQYFPDQIRFYVITVSTGQNFDMKRTSSVYFPAPVTAEIMIRSFPNVSDVPDFWSASEAYNISHVSADFSAFVNPHGSETTFWVEWGDSPLLGEATAAQSIGPWNDFLPAYDQVSGLSPGTVYYFRLAAQNGFGASYTGIDSFRTINLNAGSGRGSVFSLSVHNNSPYGRRLWLGVYDGATYCVDDTLGESNLPPLPPSGVFEVRFVDPRGFNPGCFDQGLYRDFRPLIDSNQTDTFMVKVQPGSIGLPVTFEWPDIGALYDGSAVLTDGFGGMVVNIDMKTETSFVLDNPALNTFLIITQAPNNSPLPMADVDAVRFPSVASAHLSGTVSPNGNNSAAWFEYGTTDSYGSSTDVESVYAATLFGNILGIITGLSPNTTYHYRIAAGNINGVFYGTDKTFGTALTDVGENNSSLPPAFSLCQNYPNPFNPSTSVTYSLPTSGTVSVRIFDIFGREIAALVHEWREAGKHTVEWNARGVPSGIYFYRIMTRGFSETMKMVVMK